MTESEARTWLLQRLLLLAEKMPNGLLMRLVEDAQFFYDWNLKKKKARQSSRLSQQQARKAAADAAYWSRFRQRVG